MDLASLIGLIGAVGMILAAMIAGGGVAPFIDTQSILIVFGGTFFAVMYSNPLPVFLGSFGAMAKEKIINILNFLTQIPLNFNQNRRFSCRF